MVSLSCESVVVVLWLFVGKLAHTCHRTEYILVYACTLYVMITTVAYLCYVGRRNDAKIGLRMRILTDKV